MIPCVALCDHSCLQSWASPDCSGMRRGGNWIGKSLTLAMHACFISCGQCSPHEWSAGTVLATVSSSCHLVARCVRLCSSKVAVVRPFLCRERKYLPWPTESLSKWIPAFVRQQPGNFTLSLGCVLSTTCPYCVAQVKCPLHLRCLRYHIHGLKDITQPLTWSDFGGYAAPWHEHGMKGVVPGCMSSDRG